MYRARPTSSGWFGSPAGRPRCGSTTGGGRVREGLIPDSGANPSLTRPDLPVLTCGRTHSAREPPSPASARSRRPADSVLESRMGDLFRDHDISMPLFQHRLGRYRPDFTWRSEMAILECDGWVDHGRSRAGFENDRERDAWLHAQGYVVWRFAWRQITQRSSWVAERFRRRWRCDVDSLASGQGRVDAAQRCESFPDLPREGRERGLGDARHGAVDRLGGPCHESRLGRITPAISSNSISWGC
jgi:very-short-patch-repair endonuclease